MRCLSGFPALLIASMLVVLTLAPTDTTQAVRAAESDAEADLDAAFRRQVQPVIQEHCIRCHNAETMESGIRLDRLSSRPDDRQMFLWRSVLDQIMDGAMPPEDELQPSDQQRELLSDWIPRALTAAAVRNAEFNGSVRRLTVAQYRNTLRDLLGLTEDLTKSLPPDGVTQDGFTNQRQALQLTPLQLETYFSIAQRALDLCIVDDDAQPTVQSFRVDLGKEINPDPCPDQLVLGALSSLLKNQDFHVAELTPDKPFEFRPFRMRKKYEFIEGYQGNDTVRGWREFDGIYHAVFACMRGTPGYPLGEPYQTEPAGLLLRPAIPSSEIFGESNTYGPMANFKVSLRELPDRGDFRVTVKAARYDDGLLLDAEHLVSPLDESRSVEVENISGSGDASVILADAGIYQVDVYWTNGDSPGVLSLAVDDRHFAGQLFESPSPANTRRAAPGGENASAFLILRLPAGQLTLAAQCRNPSRLRRVLLHRLDEDAQPARRFQAFEQRVPQLGVHVGLRRDCGSTLARVGEPRPVIGRELQTFAFEGAINDFPSPDVEEDNVNYLAGLREIGVRSEYTDGRDMPRLLIRSVEFEGPYYDQWPPETHRRIFFQSSNRGDHTVYAREIIERFATRAFRRPAGVDELTPVFAIFDESYAQGRGFRQSVKDALHVVLTAPQFLMLIEQSAGPQPEDLDPYELASKLSYLLWNAAPDQRLLDLAAEDRLHASLDAEIDRMIADTRFGQFVKEFAAQWLSLEKLGVVATDRKRYPTLTRDVKAELSREPIQFVQHLLRNNLSARHLVDSDLVVANDVVAAYYGLEGRPESGFQFGPYRHDDEHLGGLLTQAGILAALSDGREANPVKRGAWVARKIVAEPPDDPPPNVPQLPDDDGADLTLRQKLERHRDQKGCAKCHRGIDPWGLPLEQFDAGGLLRTEDDVDAHSVLPDGAEVADAVELKRYLARDRIDQVAFSFPETRCDLCGGPQSVVS